MNIASSKELKNELESLRDADLVKICLRLSRFKKENKELIHYLLFESRDEQAYISRVKQSLHVMFTEVNIKNLYIAKKNIRKIIRTANRFIKYSGISATEIEILLFVCQEIKGLGLNMLKSQALLNLYTSQLNKIHKGIQTLHEDLQYDYLKEFGKLQ
jgi:hypothetical protein